MTTIRTITAATILAAITIAGGVQAQPDTILPGTLNCNLPGPTTDATTPTITIPWTTDTTLISPTEACHQATNTTTTAVPVILSERTPTALFVVDVVRPDWATSRWPAE